MLQGCREQGEQAISPKPQIHHTEWFRGYTAWKRRVQVIAGVSTSLSCARSGFLEAEVGPVHSNFLTSLLCRIQTEPIRFWKYGQNIVRCFFLSFLDPTSGQACSIYSETSWKL